MLYIYIYISDTIVMFVLKLSCTETVCNTIAMHVLTNYNTSAQGYTTHFPSPPTFPHPQTKIFEIL